MLKKNIANEKISKNKYTVQLKLWTSKRDLCDVQAYMWVKDKKGFQETIKV